MAGADGLRCPFCNGMVSLAHDVCPHCNAALLIDSLEKTQSGLPIILNGKDLSKNCKICGKAMPPGRHVCQDCASENRALPEHGRKSKWDTQGNLKRQAPRFLKRRIDEFVLPASIAHFEEINFDPQLLASIQAISPENPPKAVISTDDGNIFYLIAGATLIVGRELETSHIQAILHPEQQYAQNNYKVSRTHCCFSIVSNVVFCRDMSSNGTLINNIRIGRKEDVPVVNDDIVSLARILDLRVSLTAIEGSVCTLRLERLNNGLENHYILAAGPVLFGDDPAYPIYLAHAKDVRGSIFYQPADQAWIVHAVQRSSGACIIDKTLDFIEDITLPDNIMLLFSTIQ